MLLNRKLNQRMYNPYSLEGKTILITGGAGGIGSATARSCVLLGARVILTDIREDALRSTLESLPAQKCGGENLYYTADLTKSEDLEGLIEFCPSIDGLVCNAGVMKLVPTQFITEEELTRVQCSNSSYKRSFEEKKN